MRYLRYYAPALWKDKHQKILHLLEEIKKKHGIEYEEIPVEKEEWYEKTSQMTEEEVYKMHFVPNSRLIKANDPYKMTAREIFKSGTGNVSVSGSIAVMENETVLWATGILSATEFLEDVLDGKRTINSFKSKMSAKKEDVHTQLFNLMKEKNLPNPKIKGKIWLREIATGFRKARILDDNIQREYNEDLAGRLVDPHAIQAYRAMCDLNLIDKYWYRTFLQKKLSKQYDFVRPLFITFADFIVLSKEAWIIEGKEELNYEAIGQVLVYKDLLEGDYPQLGGLRMGIACFRGDERLEPTCGKLEIEVFKLGESPLRSNLQNYLQI